MNQLATTQTELDSEDQALTEVLAAIRSRRLGRHIARPETKKPSVEGLESVAWDLEIEPEELPGELV